MLYSMHKKDVCTSSEKCFPNIHLAPFTFKTVNLQYFGKNLGYILSVNEELK